MNKTDIRWKQRFQNFEKAFLNLKKAIELHQERTLSDLESQGLIQAFQYELLDDGDIWMDMLEKRNLMVPTYDEKNAKLAIHLIVQSYFDVLAGNSITNPDLVDHIERVGQPFHKRSNAIHS